MSSTASAGGGGAASGALRSAVIAGIVVVVLLPLLPLLIQSVAHGWLYPELLPSRLDWRAWRYVVSPSSRVLEAAGNSVLIAVTVTVLCIVIAVPAGKGLSLLAPQSRRHVEYLFFAPVIVPSLAVALGLHVIFVRTGLADTITGVVFAHLLPTTPYMALVMESTFVHADRELEAQARTLGATPLAAFVLIGLPAALPGIVTGALFVFLISWSQYALTLLIGGGRVLTLPVLLFAFAGAGDLAVTAALAIVFLLPAVAILAVTSRYLTGRSLALGGVAGR